MIKVLIADDHLIFLDGLKSLLENEEEIEVVVVAENGKQALEKIAALDETQRPEIAVLDVRMPEMDGIEATKFIQKDYPEMKVLILTMYNKPEFIQELKESGASGYILKNKGKEELVDAIYTLHGGDTYYGQEVAKTFLDSLAKKSTSQKVKLTKREVEVLKCIAGGMTTPEIAEKLFISHPTVETHRRNLLSKLNLRNSLELVKYAHQNEYAE